MGLIFKISKQSLPVQCRADIIQLVAQQQRFFGVGAAVFIQIIKQQLFVYGGGYFGSKNAVVGVNIRLIFIAVLAVHHMAQCVGDGEHVI